MYNLFVSGHAGSWNGDPWTVDKARCIKEHTDDDIMKRFGDLDATQITELRSFPCVFAYEAWEKAPKFGFIREVIVQRSQAKVKVKYDLIECERFLTAAELDELQVELDIRGWEREDERIGPSRTWISIAYCWMRKGYRCLEGMTSL